VALSTEEEFRSLAEQCIPIITDYARRRLWPLPPIAVDDIVSRVLETMWRRRADIPDDATIPWVIGVTRRVLANAHRGQKRQRALMARQRSSGVSEAAEDSFIADETVRQALDQLSESDREILVLHYWDGVAVPDLAVILSITVNAAAVRLTRSRQRFESAYRQIADS
jgi:RNA polymerase sigma-70 factor (ECF subfamily)